MATVIPLGASSNKCGFWPFLLIQILVIQTAYCICFTVGSTESQHIFLLKKGEIDWVFSA
jgi:hypothetical protein